MKGFIRLQDADTCGRFVTVRVSYIVSIVSTRSGATIVKTVEGAKYSVKESLSEVEQKIKDAMCNTDAEKQDCDSDILTRCVDCVYSSNIYDDMYCSMFRHNVSSCGCCGYGQPKDSIIK